jgi:hypothetical protein
MIMQRIILSALCMKCRASSNESVRLVLPTTCSRIDREVFNRFMGALVSTLTDIPILQYLDMAILLTVNAMYVRKSN